jgi:hypothetical protein
MVRKIIVLGGLVSFKRARRTRAVPEESLQSMGCWLRDRGSVRDDFHHF